ncbi:transposase [Neolewinella sp.]|uniref:transposase n=1 Tax=Neolewinella sp. TaxID=2993543 RepID=UPI003B521714
MSAERIIAFDPSYIAKSGKCTDGVGKFWSGCVGQLKHGLELTGLAAVDLKDKTALHLLAVQTVLLEQGESLLDYYASILVLQRQTLLRVSSQVVADAYFSKKPFVDQLLGAGFELVSRLRNDAHLRYLYRGVHVKRPGARKQFAGRVNVRDLDHSVFDLFAEAEDRTWKAYQAVVNAKALKRRVGVVIIHDLDAGGVITAHRIYLSTDQGLTGPQIVHAYQCRFQQEFLYRDAKQQLGLEHSQAYTWPKIDFHFNLCLTVGSLAKAAHHLVDQTQRALPFSIADIKTCYVNDYQARRTTRMFGIDPESTLIRSAWSKITNFGLRRA